MLENVTQNATSFVSTIVETDWNKEFQEIQEGLREDTQTLENEVEKKLGITCPLSHLWLLSESLKLHQLLQMTQLQRSGATYCDEPADKEQFAAFLEAYDEESRQEEARLILASNTFMADLHSRLVPLVISDDTFWQRYFFRCGL